MYDSFVLPKLLLGRLLVALLLVLLAARCAVTRAIVIKRTPIDVPLLLFIASAVLSTLFAENANVAIFGTYARYDGLLTLVTYALLFWLTVQTLTGEDQARELIQVLLVSGYFVAAIAIFQSLHDSLDQGAFGHMLASGGAFVAAFGSLGNPNVLGAFLALVTPLAIGELLLAGSVVGRLLWLNVVVVALLALLLTYSRSSWLGAGAGAAFVLVLRRRQIGAAGLVAGAVAAVVLVVAAGFLSGALLTRAESLLNPGTRAGIWTDSLHLIASRPVLGYGPDNVGLVFPRFQTGDWGLAGSLRQPIDKAHAEVLQVGATQGVVGIATYIFLLLAFAWCFWRARGIDRARVAAGGWLGYQLVVQLNFTALGAALPFWVFAAAALWSCGAVRVTPPLVLRRARLLIWPGVVLAAVIAWWGVALPSAADARLREAVDADFAGHKQEAQRLAAEARQLDPWESVYAVEAANLAFEQDAWAAARDAYRDAARLGTFNDLVYRNLALADRNLGLTAESRAAARQAVQLDRFDPANQALLAEFGN